MQQTDEQSGEKIFKLWQLTASIRKNLLANNDRIADVWIEGEISGCKLYPSGNRYFTLKDEKSSINCTLFKFKLPYCCQEFKDKLEKGDAEVNGLKVQVQGEIDFNMTRGQYGFKINRLRLAGLGDKMEAFKKLKAQIDKEGLNKLDHSELRRPLPYLPQRIGIVTSPAGAVIHDMCQVLTRRFENIQIRLYPCKVQGDGAEKSIVAGIEYFNKLLDWPADDPRVDNWRADILIVGRGGGSVEDLWVYNEEAVVRAVAFSKIPIISAVGHESDTTLCDYVADFRAGTPSIAAECAVRVKKELCDNLNVLRNRLDRSINQIIQSNMQQVDYLTHRLITAPSRVFNGFMQTLNSCNLRLTPALKDKLAKSQQSISLVESKLVPQMKLFLERLQTRIDNQKAKLALLNPYDVLKRGYSITTTSDGKVVCKVSDVKTGDHLLTKLKEGEVESVVI